MSSANSPTSPQARQLSAGLAKLGIALKSKAWREAGTRQMTPTQAQILTFLHGQNAPVRLSTIAEGLAVTLPTASDAVTTLEKKELLVKTRAADDARAVAISLTVTGKREAWRIASWPDFLARATEVLDPDERAVLLKGLTKMIRTLQTQGEIPISAMCVTCTHFRANAYPHDRANPHHCMLTNSPFGDSSLRIDCPEHEPADSAQAQEAWLRFVDEGDDQG